MSNLFTQEPVQKPKQNVFDLSHDVKLSTRMGRLTPICIMDTVPGDKISIKASTFIRFAPMVAPVMHMVSAYCHFYFVPNRILWDNWENFITGGEDGQDTSVPPTFDIDLSNVNTGQLHDYLGLPVGDDIGGSIVTPVSALPFNAYQLIFDQYYRDQNLQPSTYEKLIDGPNPMGNNNILHKRAWQHDYFTSALPWTQKGPEALLPLQGTAPITFKTDNLAQGNFQHIMDQLGTSPVNLGQRIIAGGPSSSAPNQDGVTLASAGGPDVSDGWLNIEGTHEADLTGATQTSIIDLRRAFKLQEWLEKNARGGSRYNESILIHFGVKTSDSRLQRPEFLGGTSSPVKISEVLQTNASSSDVQQQDTPQGNMAGHAISVGSGDYVSHFCEEHGYIIGIMSIMPKSAYQQGIPKHFLRRDKFDYFWPEFQHIGEQPIENQEIYINGIPDDLSKPFGYTPRYAEYKYVNNRVAGNYRDNLDFWHMGRKFKTAPALNADFIQMDDQETDRIFAHLNYDPITGDPVPIDQRVDNMWCHVLNTIKAQRPMAVFGTPKF